jgi:hypothetical protein
MLVIRNEAGQAPPRLADPGMFYTCEGPAFDTLAQPLRSNEYTITIHNAPDGPCVVRFPIVGEKGTHQTTMNGHQVSISYSVMDLTIDIPNGGKKYLGRHRSVTGVTWDGRGLRVEAKK